KLYAVILAAVVATGCTSASPTAPDAAAARSSVATLPPPAPTRNSDIVHVPLFIQDANGQPPTTPSTPLFESRKHNAVLAPDSHQVPLAEFTAVDGYVTAQCLSGGTHVTLHLEHLIPRGLYTAWNLIFNPPGFEPTFANLIALSVIGAPSGTQNVFRASASG